MDIDQIKEALDGLRKGLQNDGADLVIDSISNEHVGIRLYLHDNACRECIVEPDVLIAVVEAALREVVPSKTKILLLDPRVNGTSE